MCILSDKQITDLMKQSNRYRRETLTLQNDVDELHGLRTENEALEQEVLRYESGTLALL